MFRLIVVGMIAFTSLFGCASAKGRVKNGLRPDNIIEKYYVKQVRPKIIDGTFRQPCDNFVAQGDYDGAMLERNKVIDNLLNGVDLNYGRYKEYLISGKAGIDTFTEFTTITLSSLGTLLTNTDVIRSLAAASTVIQGTKAAADKNFLLEQSSHMVAIKMDQLRATKYAEIKNKKILPYKDYQLDEAIHDATEYYNAGTIAGAVLAIVSEAGERKEKADMAARKSDDLKIKNEQLNTELEILKKEEEKTKLKKKISPET